jgi:hypothetical protein
MCRFNSCWTRFCFFVPEASEPLAATSLSLIRKTASHVAKAGNRLLRDDKCLSPTPLHIPLHASHRGPCDLRANGVALRLGRRKESSAALAFSHCRSRHCHLCCRCPSLDVISENRYAGISIWVGAKGMRHWRSNTCRLTCPCFRILSAGERGITDCLGACQVC